MTDYCGCPRASASTEGMTTMTTETEQPASYAMKNRHPVTTWLLWPFLTMGIYSLVWYYKIHKEMAYFDRREAVPVAGPMLVLLFLGWTVVAPLVSYYNAGMRIRTAQRAAGLEPTCEPAWACLLAFAFHLNVLYMQLQLNKIADAYGAPAGTPIELAA